MIVSCNISFIACVLAPPHRICHITFHCPLNFASRRMCSLLLVLIHVAFMTAHTEFNITIRTLYKVRRMLRSINKKLEHVSLDLIESKKIKTA